MTAADLHEWIRQGRLDQIPVMADAAEEVSNPQALHACLAEGLRVCQQEDRAPARIWDLKWPGGGGVFTDKDIQAALHVRALERSRGELSQKIRWGWRGTAERGPGAVEPLRHAFIHGSCASPGVSWQFFDDPVVAIAVFGRVSVALGGPQGPVVAANAFYSGRGRNPFVIHAVRAPLNDRKIQQRPALCGRTLSSMSIWEGQPKFPVSCDKCRGVMRRMLAFYGRQKAAARCAKGDT